MKKFPKTRKDYLLNALISTILILTGFFIFGVNIFSICLAAETQRIYWLGGLLLNIPMIAFCEWLTDKYF